MKINTTEPLKDVRGAVIHVERPGADPSVPAVQGPPMTLGDVIVDAFLMALRGDEQTDVGVKSRQYRLVTRLVDADGEVEITPEEATMIRERVAKAYYLRVAGPALMLLEG